LGDSFCYGCMRQKQQRPVCELCGFDERTRNERNQLPIGTVLMRQYVIGRVLGQGGFGITYIGWDQLLQIPVAIKEYFPMGIVHRDLRYGFDVECTDRDQAVFEKHRDRFLKEARTLAQLSTVPEIVQIKNFFVANNTAYIVMEYVQGITLKTYLKNLGRPMMVPEALEIMKPVLQGLRKVHDHQLVHRDISPDNIMLPGPGSVKLIDFGTARNMDESMRSKSTESILKPGFAPLEQYNTKGNLGTWTDVYAICGTFHYLLTGKVLPDAPTRIEDGDQLPLLEQVPTMTPGVLKTLQGGLAIRAADRIQTVEQLQEKLYASEQKKKKSRAKPEKPDTSKAKPVKSEEETTSRKKNKLLLPVLAAVLAVAAAAVLMLMPKHDQPIRKEEAPASIQKMEPQDTIGADRAEETEAHIAEPVELSVMAAQYSDSTTRWWGEFVEDFETAYPNVNLVVDVVSWNDIYTRIDTRVAKGQAPDILNIDIYENYQEKGLLLPVEAYVSRETYEKFYSNMLDNSSTDGIIWAVPDLCNARGMFCNMDILNAAGVEVPTTWQELEEVCQILKAFDPGIYPWGVDMTTDEGQACFAYYTLNNGGGYLDENGNWALNSEKNVQAVQFVAGLVEKGLTNPDPVTENRYLLQDMFCSGKVAMMIAPYNMGRYIESSGASMNYRVAPIPVNIQAPSKTLAVMDRMMVFDNHQSEAELAAITCFFDFFYEDSRYTDWVAMEGFLPATSSGTRYLEQTNPDQAVWREILEHTVFYPVWLDEWWTVKTGVIEVQQRALLGENPDGGLDTLQANVCMK